MTRLLAAAAILATLLGATGCNSAEDENSAASSAGEGAAPFNLATFDAHDPRASGMVLTFDDEFNRLDAGDDGPAEGKRWTTHSFWERAGSNPEDAIRVQNGILVIEAHREGQQWSRGGFLSSIDSRGLGFSQRFGYFEARIQIPRGQGGFPAFWLMSTPHAVYRPAPASELDIMEAQTGDTHRYWGTIHRDSDEPHHGDRFNRNHDIRVDMDLSSGFHTYGLLWPPDSNEVTWYLDGKPIISAPKYDTTDKAPMMININFGTGGWDGPPDRTTPDRLEMKVDYIRVYQFPGLKRAAKG